MMVRNPMGGPSSLQFLTFSYTRAPGKDQRAAARNGGATRALWAAAGDSPEALRLGAPPMETRMLTLAYDRGSATALTARA